MEQDVIFFSKPWLPVIFYYLTGIIAFLGCYLLYRLIKLHSNTPCRFLFIIVTTLSCAVHIVTGYYDVVGYHGYGYRLLRAHYIADYETIRYGVILFVTLNGLLIWRVSY